MPREPQAASTRATRPGERLPRGSSDPESGYALALAGAAGAVATAALAQRWLGLENLSLVFIVAVLMVASRTRTGPALVTAALCFLGYNFFFFEPRYTFYISAREGVTTIVLFLATALVAGRLASRLAMQVQALRAANLQALTRQELGHRLAVATEEKDVIEAARTVFRDSIGAEIWMRVDDRGLSAMDVESPAQTRPQQAGGRHQGETAEQHGWWFLPLEVAGEALGMIGLKLPEASDRLYEGQRRLARDMAGDIAQALLRTRLDAALQAERVANETERLRSALLSSVSHDLRTPLAAMLGAAESLESYGESLDDADRRVLLDTVRKEGGRLDRYIQNLLDMTRLGHGEIALSRDWIGVDELLGSAIGRLRRYQPGVAFSVLVADGIGPVWVHPALVEQALFNVIENAAKFSPPGATIRVDASLDTEGDLRIDVGDRGPGIPPEARERIFEMFYSLDPDGHGDRGREGTGLGLAICRGMIGAHGGHVEALQGEGGRGTTIRITLPLTAPNAGGLA